MVRRTHCIKCGRKRRWLSTRGICKYCAEQQTKDLVDSMINKRGPIYEKWKRSMKKVAERIENE